MFLVLARALCVPSRPRADRGAPRLTRRRRDGHVHGGDGCRPGVRRHPHLQDSPGGHRAAAPARRERASRGGDGRGGSEARGPVARGAGPARRREGCLRRAARRSSGGPAARAGGPVSDGGPRAPRPARRAPRTAGGRVGARRAVLPSATSSPRLVLPSRQAPLDHRGARCSTSTSARGRVLHRRLELDEKGKKTHGFEHCKTKVVLTKVLAPLGARSGPRVVAGLASPRTVGR